MVKQKEVLLPSDVKLANRKKILNCFLDGAAHSLTSVSEEIGASRLTVNKAIKHFVQMGVLESLGKGNSTKIGGRKPEEFNLSKNIYCLTINVEYDNIIFTVFNLFSEIKYIFSLPVDKDMTIEGMLEIIKSGSIKTSEIVENNKFGCIGFTIRGLVDNKNGILRYSTYYAKWPKDINMVNELKIIFPEVKQIVIDKPVRIFTNLLYKENEKNFPRKKYWLSIHNMELRPVF